MFKSFPMAADEVSVVSLAITMTGVGAALLGCLGLKSSYETDMTGSARAERRYPVKLGPTVLLSEKLLPFHSVLPLRTTSHSAAPGQCSCSTTGS